MSAGTLAPVADRALVELYARCKALTLAAGASLLLAQEEPGLQGEALALALDAQALQDPSGRAALIEEAALAVAALGDRTTDRDEALVRVRLAHRRLRVGLGTLLLAQYAPCGAHSHAKEENHG